MQKRRCLQCNKVLDKKHKKYCSIQCKAKYEKIHRKKIDLISTKKARCKICKSLVNDYENISGGLVKHLRKYHNIICSDKNGAMQYFDIINVDKPTTIQCPYCDWDTIDVENKSGYFFKHTKLKHNKTKSEVFEDFPHLKNTPLFSPRYIAIENTKQRLANDDKFSTVCMICGKAMKKISNSHLQKHNITANEYKLKYGEESLISCNSRALHRQHLIDVGGNISSLGESSVNEFMKSILEPDCTIINNDKSVLGGLELDIYIPSRKLAIEYNGLYWHSELHKHKTYHKEKTELCESAGIRLIHIFEDDWNNKNELIKHRIRHLLAPNEYDIVYARNTIIDEVTTNEAKQFLTDNHIQGYAPASIKLAAKYNGHIVALMTFSKPRNIFGNYKSIKDDNNIYELVRYATSNDYSVRFTASKLLSYFIRNYNPSSIFSYAKRDWTSSKQNNLYTHLGFKLQSISDPGYWYVVNNRRVHRYNYRKQKLIEMGADKNKSESDIMAGLGLYKIYDSGNLVYVRDLHTI